MTEMLLPVTDDIDTGGFFAAACDGHLAVRRCNGCDRVLHMPVQFCRDCGSWDGRWEPVAGTGTVYSWTVVEHQVHPRYPTPYTIVLVELDDLTSVRFVGRLDGAPDLAVGRRVEVDLAEGDEVVVPQWRLLPSG